jgi:putative transposase
MLKCEGWQRNVQKNYSIYNGMNPCLKNETPTQRVKAKLREDRKEVSQASETGAMDFVLNLLATSRKFMILAVVDTFKRFSPIIDPRFSYR